MGECRCPSGGDGLRFCVPAPGGGVVRPRGLEAAAEAAAGAVLRAAASVGTGRAATSEPLLLCRDGEQFKFVYGTTTDPASAGPEPPQSWDESQLLFVFRVGGGGGGSSSSSGGGGGGGGREPWAVVGPSAALAARGLRGQELYAWGEGFRVGQRIGVYVGEVLGPAAAPLVASTVAALPTRRHPWSQTRTAWCNPCATCPPLTRASHTAPTPRLSCSGTTAAASGAGPRCKT
jgi:hypothetical protein